LHSQDGAAVYVNRYIDPSFFVPNEVQSEIDRLSAKFGERAHEFRMPQREGLPNAIIAVWGKIELQQLDAADVATEASGGTVKGLLVSFLGDLQRSAKAGYLFIDSLAARASCGRQPSIERDEEFCVF
jgi:hypothetical protein